MFVRINNEHRLIYVLKKGRQGMQNYRMNNRYEMQRRKKKRRKKRIRFIKNLLLVVILAVLLVFLVKVFILQGGAEKIIQLSKTYISGENEDVEENIDLGGLYSPYAVLVDLDTGKTIGARNDTEKIYPASMTKIMTAIVAIENTPDLEKTITMPYDIYSGLYAQNASMAGFQPGEEAKMIDLIYGMLLPSGAECCLAAAGETAGAEEAFVDLMNEKAKELGMNDTHFKNTTGLHDPEHYSTVRDISVLLKYALENETFRQAFTSSRYSTGSTEQHPGGFTFYSTVLSYLDGNEIENGAILGGKSGYTEEAGLCLASLGEVNGKEYILVTAGAQGDHQTEQYHILDAVDVYNRIGK